RIWVRAGREAGGGGGAAARRRIEGPPDDAGRDQAALPHQLAVEIDVSPERRADGAVGSVHQGERDVALAGGRPGRGRHAARLLAARAGGIEKCIVRGLLTRNIETDELLARPTLGLREQRPAPGEMPLVEIDQPRESELERRALGTEVQ